MDFDALWNFADPAGTERQFRAALPALATEPAAYNELLTQIARTLGLQRQFEAAHTLLDEAAERLAASPHPPRVLVRYHLERGRAFNSARARERASGHFRQAWEAARAAGEDFYAVDAAHMLGVSEPPAEAEHWSQTAIACAEASADPRARYWLGALYNNLGWTVHDRGAYAQALDLFERAVRFREAKGQLTELHIARWCVARCLRSLGRWRKACDRQWELLATPQGAADGYVLEELAECLLVLGAPAAAEPFFARAHAALRQDAWLAANEAPRLERLAVLGGVHPQKAAL
jgi:tetratricopeptide (TPR) repeat protein